MSEEVSSGTSVTSVPTSARARVGGASPYLWLGLGHLVNSNISILIKLSASTFWTIATYRLAFAVLAAYPIIRMMKIRPFRDVARRDLALMALSGVFLAMDLSMWTASIKFTSVASATLFVSLSPIVVAIVAFFLLGERPSARTVTGIAVGMAGSAIIGSHDFQISGVALFGDLLAFSGAVCWAGCLTIGRRIRRDYDSWSYSYIMFLASFLTVAVLAVGAGDPLRPATTPDIVVFVLLGTACTVGTHTMYSWVLKYVQTSIASITFLAQPVLATGIAWLVFGETVPLTTFVGGVVILTGVYLATTTRRPGN